MNQLELLWSLQQLDVELDRLHRCLDELKPGDGKKSVLEQLQEQKAVLEEKMKRQQKSIRQKEMDLQKIDEEKEVLYQKLYGKSMARGRELEQLEKKYRLVEDEKDRIENEIIEQMEGAERIGEEIISKENEIKKLQRDYQRNESKRLKEAAFLEEKIEDLSARRSSLAGQVSPALLARYSELFTRFNGEGLALLRGGLCEGCRVFQPSSIIDRLNTPGALVYCENCGRLLVKIE